MSDAAEREREAENRRPMQVLRVVFFLGLLNFAAFMISSAIIGGDAINGKIEPGHYFVGSHGKYTEVSPAVFQYSQWHARSLWLSHPLALLAGLGMVMLGPRRKRSR